MNRLILVGLLGLLCALPAKSQTMVYKVSRGSSTVFNVTISTDSGAVRVDSPSASRYVKGRFEIEVYNDDSTDSLRCSFTSAVSTVTSPSVSAHFGREVRPKTGVAWKVPDSVPVYCRIEGSGAAASALAIITQL